MATVQNPDYGYTPAAAASDAEVMPTFGSTLTSVLDDLDPTYREVFFTATLAMWFAFGLGLDSASADILNTIGLIAFSAILGWGGYRQMTRNVATLWTPLLWYRVAMMTYFGVGSLVPIWTNDATREMMQGFYKFYGYEITKLNVLITIFHLLFLLTSKVTLILFRARIHHRPDGDFSKSLIKPSNVSMISFGSLCVFVGSSINYFVVFPQTVGWINLTFFSTIYNLAALSWLGYFMVALWALQHRRLPVLIIVLVIALGESVIGFFSMSKSVILLPLVMIGLAFIYHNRSTARILIFGGAIVSAFLYLSPMIAYVRNANFQYYNGAATVAETPQIYMAYLNGDRQNDEYADVDSGWVRLSYVNAGTFAISQFDHGMPGNSYRYWSVVWVPRVLYPDKPFITDVAREFSYAANGNYDSSSSAGLAAEAYWNFGWVGVIGIAIVTAIVFSLWSLYSFIVIQRSAWHLFFIVLLGMRTAIRTDGAFVSDIMGPIGIAVLAHIMLELMNRFLPRILGGRFANKAVLH